MDKYYPQRTILWHLNVFLVRWDMLKLILDQLRKVTKKLFGLPIHHWLIITKFVRLLLINTIPKNYFVTLEVFFGTSRHALVKIYSGTYAQIFYNIWLGEFVGFKWVKIHSNCLKKKCLDKIIWYIILNGNLLFCICSGSIECTARIPSAAQLSRRTQGHKWAKWAKWRREKNNFFFYKFFIGYFFFCTQLNMLSIYYVPIFFNKLNTLLTTSLCTLNVNKLSDTKWLQFQVDLSLFTIIHPCVSHPWLVRPPMKSQTQ